VRVDNIALLLEVVLTDGDIFDVAKLFDLQTVALAWTRHCARENVNLAGVIYTCESRRA
jgi:hypothetical protein